MYVIRKISTVYIDERNVIRIIEMQNILKKYKNI